MEGTETKKILRSKFITQRSKRTQNAKENESLCKHIVEWVLYNKVEEVYAFYPFRNEPDLRSLQQLLPGNIKMALPVCNSANSLDFYPWAKETVLVKNKYGIPEPVKNNMLLHQDQSKILILLPALAVDRNGNRLGYGGGYYDRFLCDRKISYKMAVVWDEFILENDLPSEEFDIPVEYVVSQNKIKSFVKH